MQEAKLKKGFRTSKKLPVEIGDAVRTLEEWADIFNIPYYVLKTRYGRGERGKHLVRPARGYKNS